MRRLLILAVLWSAGAAALYADVITLKSGHRIEGEVLKATDRELIVDIGIELLRVPVEKIESRVEAAQAGKVVTQAATDDIYTMAELPVRSVKELAEAYGEGVVLIETPSGLGSGFVVNKRGYCVTNYHVVEKETRIAVTLFHKGKADFVKRRIDDVKILALNPVFDLALLQIPEQKDFELQVAYLAGETEQKEGDEVFAIGNPLGLERSVSQGIISTRTRNFDGVLYIQTTAEINPGNSGGPLFNRRGEVIGVTNMKLVGGEGLGFAIPIAYVKYFLKNREAYAFDANNPNTGYRYLDPPRRRLAKPPEG